MARTFVHMHLRTHQMAYLRREAARREVDVSDVLALVIDATALQCAAVARPAYKARAHLALSEEHLVLVDRQAALLGVVRSDVIRRLIDEAMSRTALAS